MLGSVSNSGCLGVAIVTESQCRCLTSHEDEIFCAPRHSFRTEEAGTAFKGNGGTQVSYLVDQKRLHHVVTYSARR